MKSWGMMSWSDTSSGSISLSTAISEALTVSTTRGERVCVVGGVVRDLLMGRAVGDYDLDLVVEGSAREFAIALQRVVGGELKEHTTFLTCKLTAPFSSLREGVTHSVGATNEPLLSEIDIVTSRSEVYHRPGALPQVVAASLEEDLARRDFSCNAMALSLAAYQICFRESPGFVDGRRLGEFAAQHHFFDPCNGLADIRNGELRILHPRSFVDDPTRLFRALRYASRLGFSLESSTEGSFRQAVSDGVLQTISARRIWNEVVTVLEEAAAQEILREGLDRGLFMYFPLVDEALLGSIEEPLNRLAASRDKEQVEDVISARKMVVFVRGLQQGKEALITALQESRTLVRGAREVLICITRGDAQPPQSFSRAQLLASLALR
jgi:tRNA nucleotidyltransferase/poly(A) polymerase